MPLLEIWNDLDASPIFNEYKKAHGKLKLRVTPEMLVFGGPALRKVLLKLFQRVWSKGQVFAAWRDFLLVPIFKKVT